MVKTPRTRHSKSQREPKTIDLDPADIKTVDAGQTSATAEQPPSSEQPAEPETVEAMRASGEDISLLDDGPARESIDADASATPYPPSPSEEAARPDADESVSDETAASHDSVTDRTEAGSDARQDSPSRPYAAQPSPAAPARSGGAGRFAAGLAGGVVALLLAGLLQFAGLLGGTGTSTDGSGLQGQIDGLKAEIEAVKSGAGAAGSAELAAGLDAVRKDVAALQEALSAGAAGDGPALQALDQRLKELEATVSSLGSGSGAGEDVAALGDRIAAVEGAAKAAQEAADGVASQVAALEQSVSALSARVEAQANQPKIALAIATAALKSAVDRGAPFTAELETLAALAPQSPEIAALRSHAETGVATREALRAEFDAAAAAMIAAASPTDPDAGFFDRLLQSAESLVSVRPIGEVQGAGVPETVARLQVALDAGDLDKAIAEYESLPDGPKAAATAFAVRLKARRDVERLVDQAIATAMKA